ncbi:MAG: hypothetical protein ACF8CY_03405 [Gimesia chilikensis]
MKYILGNYELEHAKLIISQDPVRIGGSLLRLMVIRHSVTGKLRADTQAQLEQKIAAFENVFSSSYVAQVGLYKDDGSPSEHIINNAATLDGIKLIAGPSYPVGDGAEYSLFRTVSFTLQAEVKDPNRDLIQFQETISVSGGSRPSAWLLPADGTVTEQDRQRLVRTPYVVTQSGSAETYSNVFSFPGALGGIELDEQSQVHAGAEFNQGKLATHRWQWNYRWTAAEVPSAAILQPTDRRGSF